jgi:hypothetical protein
VRRSTTSTPTSTAPSVATSPNRAPPSEPKPQISSSAPKSSVPVPPPPPPPPPPVQEAPKPTSERGALLNSIGRLIFKLTTCREFQPQKAKKGCDCRQEQAPSLIIILQNKTMNIDDYLEIYNFLKISVTEEREAPTIKRHGS